jgi:GT2 family glycosyltransferase
MSAPSSQFPDDVDVAVVSHNGRATLPRVLTDLISAGVPSARVIVYDIASTDGTGEWLGQDWPDVGVVRLAENAGPNPARNRALADATRPYLLLLDSDAYIYPRTPAILRQTMAHKPGVGAAVPVVVHADRPDVIQYAGGRLHFVCEAINPWTDRLVSERGLDVQESGTAPGVCFLLDVAIARRVGGFDDAYFLGKDDGEFCFRLRLAGFTILEAGEALVGHNSRPRSTWLFPFQVRNRWHFMLKNYATRTLVLLSPALLIHEVVQFALLAARGEGRAWMKALRMIGPMCATLGTDRHGVQNLRRVPDGYLLDAAPLLVRADLVGGRAGAFAKSLYDRWLTACWRLVARWLR